MTVTAQHLLPPHDGLHVSEDPLWTTLIMKEMNKTDILTEERDLQCKAFIFFYSHIVI